MAVIVIATSVSAPAPGWFDLGGLDRFLHAGFYAVLAALVARAFGRSGAGEAAGAAATLIVTLAFGGLMEWVQGLVERSPDVLDWAADAAGAGVALGVRAARHGIRDRG
jgi:hypothetical protein